MSKHLLRLCVSFALTAGNLAAALTNASVVHRVHDPSTIIRAMDEFWTFATGDGIKTLRSTNLTEWHPGQPAFVTNPAWTADVAPPHRDYLSESTRAPNP